MLRYDGVYIHESEEGGIECLRFYLPRMDGETLLPSPITAIGMKTFLDSLDDDLRWFGRENANRFALGCTHAPVSIAGTTLRFALTPEVGSAWSNGRGRRFEGTIREDSLDLESHKCNESFDTCPHILCYFEFRPLPPDFEQANAPTEDPKTEVCVRCGVRAFKDSCLKETLEGFICRGCDPKAMERAAKVGK